jgi:uncharacterized membrane protein YraQ (UPF0718 family)
MNGYGKAKRLLMIPLHAVAWAYAFLIFGITVTIASVGVLAKELLRALGSRQKRG